MGMYVICAKEGIFIGYIHALGGWGTGVFVTYYNRASLGQKRGYRGIV